MSSRDRRISRHHEGERVGVEYVLHSSGGAFRFRFAAMAAVSPSSTCPFEHLPALFVGSRGCDLLRETGAPAGLGLESPLEGSPLPLAPTSTVKGLNGSSTFSPMLR
ncbi:MAG: hypothetical protein GY835_01525 [bacterium]|nr:hypothetical protein [bacterium]